MSRIYYDDGSSEKEFIYWEVTGFTLGLLTGSCLISHNEHIATRVFVYTSSSYLGILSSWLLRYSYQYNKRIPYYLFSIGILSLITPFFKKNKS